VSTEDLLRELAATGRALGSAVRPPGADGLLAALTTTARRLFGAAACSLALLTDDESELVYVAASGAGADHVIGMRMPSGRGLAGWVAASGQPVAISELRSDPRWASDVAESTGYVPRALLAVPVQSPDRMLGVLTLLDRNPDRPDADRDIEFLNLFAEQAALAVEAVHAFEDVGRVLLDALVDAADGEAAGAATSGLRGALEHRAAAGEQDADLAELAALFAALTGTGAAERELAVRVVQDVLRYTRARRGS
jgi:GAF domain-containing protein